MATVGSVTLTTLRSDLRARVNEIAPDKFDDGELTRWLNVGQQETMIRIKEFNEAWYMAPKTLTINVADNAADNIDVSGANYFTTDWAKVNEIHYIKATTYTGGNTGSIPIVPLAHVYDYAQSSIHTGYAKCAQVGEYLYFTDNLATSDVFVVFYYRNPVDMSADSDTLDVPNWAQDLVIMFAFGQCLRKLNRDAAQNDAAISQRLNQIKQVFSVDKQLDDQMHKEGTVK